MNKLFFSLIFLTSLFFVPTVSTADIADIAPWQPEIWTLPLGGISEGGFGFQPWNTDLLTHTGAWFMSFPDAAADYPDILANVPGRQDWQEVVNIVPPQVFSATVTGLAAPLGAAVPEPTSMLLFGSTIVGLVALRKRV